MSTLSEAIQWSEENYPLPRCEHGYVLRDHGYELYEPPCGCRLVQGQDGVWRSES